MGECIVDANGAELVAVPSPEWTAGRRDDEPRDVGGRLGSVKRVDVQVALIAKALVDRAVLGVDRHDFCALGRPSSLDHRRPGDQRLFVR